MIVSRPKSNALFAIVVFLMICFSLGIVNLNILLEGGRAWYNYLIVIVTFGIGFSILFKQMIGFKIITVGEETFKVARPFLFSGYQFKVKNIEFWEETLIDTKNGQFKEIAIAQDSGKKLKITLQENSNYKKIKDYLGKKAGKKQKRSK
jgi:hypothetical protein